MHKTEGTNHSLNTFTDGPPGTTVEENWLNAVQDELVNAIEDSGQTLKSAAAETGDQLKTALRPGVGQFTDGDATPSIIISGVRYKVFKTGTSGLTITDFDDGEAGDEITVISKGAIVFDTTGTNLIGSSVDLTTASGDVTKWVCEDGTTWRLLAFVDVSADNSSGA